MIKQEYDKLVKKYTKEEDKLKNALIAFISGGVIGIISVIIYQILLMLNITNDLATIWTIVILVFLSSLFTGIGFFDEWVKKFRCGIIIPITGFAHSVTSAILEYKKDGLITGVGGNAFKLAGSVIVYGIFASFVLALIKVVFNV